MFFSACLEFLTAIPVIGSILLYIIKNKIVFYTVVGSMLDNIVLVFLAGQLCNNIYHLILHIIVSIIISMSTDALIVLFVRYFLKKITINKNKLISYLSSYGKYLLLFYRFIPFIRTPILSILSISLPLNILLKYNFIGSILWSTSLYIIGYIYR